MKESVNDYLQIIYKLSELILNDYQKLENLEKKGLKNSNKYQESLKHLNSLLEQEKKVYESCQANPFILRALLNQLNNGYSNETDFIVPKNKESLIHTRISLKANIYFTLAYQNKSPEIFMLFNKFDLFSSIHFESILLSLILFNNFLNNYPHSQLKKALVELTYRYSFIFPYIEDNIVYNDFSIPNELYSQIAFLQCEININDEIINNFKKQKFQQVKKYLKKNNINDSLYIFLIFYLKTLSFSLDTIFKTDIDKLINKSSINKQWKDDLKKQLRNEDVLKLVRNIFLKIKKEP